MNKRIMLLIAYRSVAGNDAENLMTGPGDAAFWGDNILLNINNFGRGADTAKAPGHDDRLICRNLK